MWLKTCDRVAIMYAGEIVESGTHKDIFKDTRIRTRCPARRIAQHGTGHRVFYQIEV